MHTHSSPLPACLGENMGRRSASIGVIAYLLNNYRTKEIRKEIMEFAKEMERIMQQNDSKKGDSWKHMNIVALEIKLDEEIAEWKEVRHKLQNIDKKMKELIDMANVCMMLWHRLKEMKNEG